MNIEEYLMKKRKSPIQTRIKYLSKKIGINDINIKVKNNLKEFQVDFIIKENKDITITISSLLEKNNLGCNRLYTCLKFWLKYLDGIQKSLNKNQIMFSINISDEGDPKILSMDSTNSCLLIPDEFSMIESIKNIKTPQKLSFNDFYQNWDTRKHYVFWRGSTTGGYIDSTKSIENIPRIKLCMKNKNQTNFNMKISNICQHTLPKKIIIDWLKSNEIAGKRVNENKFSKYCYYPDIPGNTLAWGTILKYKNGNLIFKPKTKRNLLYHKFIRPWKEYIPVKEDFSDLSEKYLWAEKNKTETAQIAFNGYNRLNEYIENLSFYFKNAIINSFFD